MHTNAEAEEEEEQTNQDKQEDSFACALLDFRYTDDRSSGGKNMVYQHNGTAFQISLSMWREHNQGVVIMTANTCSTFQ